MKTEITKESLFTVKDRYFHAATCVTIETPRGASYTFTEQWRENGMIKTWKRDPQRFQLPIKYGLKECWYLTPDNAADFHFASLCVPNTPDHAVFHVSAIAPAKRVIEQTRRDHYRARSTPRADHYRHALERAGVLLPDPTPAPSNS